jgi:hypothetical protein
LQNDQWVKILKYQQQINLSYLWSGVSSKLIRRLFQNSFTLSNASLAFDLLPLSHSSKLSNFVDFSILFGSSS